MREFLFPYETNSELMLSLKVPIVGTNVIFACTGLAVAGLGYIHDEPVAVFLGISSAIGATCVAFYVIVYWPDPK